MNLDILAKGRLQGTGSGGDASFGRGFRGDGFEFCRGADGVGDDPSGAGDGDADGIGGPVEVVFGGGCEIWNPEQQLEDQDLRREQACGERRLDAGEDGYSGAEKAQRGGVGPEHSGRRQPTRDRVQQAGHVFYVDDAEGYGANTEEEHEEVPAGRYG